MSVLQKIAAGLALALAFAGSLNYIPGLTDEQGRSFGIFALDIYDDALHFGSALWAAIAAWTSRNAAKNFLQYFGILYFADGLLGLITGSGYLDLGIINYGWQDLDFSFKILANLPHLGLGGIALGSALFFGKREI
jgi:hypothetical protein